MSNSTRNVSVCRRCVHYQVEGRRGGQCDLLGTSVQGKWSACTAARPVFQAAIAPSEGISAAASGASRAIALEEMITALKTITDAMEPRLLDRASYSDIYLASEVETDPEETSYLASATAW